MRAVLLAGTVVILSACSAAPSKAPAQETAPARGEVVGFPGTDGTPEERYWQLYFALALTDGIDPDLLTALQDRYGAPDGDSPRAVTLAEYQGAGFRIANAEGILDATSDLAALRSVAQEDMRAALRELELNHPEALAAIDQELLAEEILIVRSAVLDSLETVAAEDARFQGAVLDDYRAGTLRARNQLEYEVFAQDMDRLASTSMENTAGRLDAFHRMLDDNDSEAFLRERIEATEEMNRQLSDEHRDYAARRTARTLFFLLPALNSYFRYR